ncbi:MAG: hypothetical protein ACT4NY_33500 [Pseudonocardiales bacterium]
MSHVDKSIDLAAVILPPLGETITGHLLVGAGRGSRYRTVLRIRGDHFDEVRDELGLEDLQITDEANPALVDWLAGPPA